MHVLKCRSAAAAPQEEREGAGEGGRGRVEGRRQRQLRRRAEEAAGGGEQGSREDHEGGARGARQGPRGLYSPYLICLKPCIMRALNVADILVREDEKAHRGAEEARDAALGRPLRPEFGSRVVYQGVGAGAEEARARRRAGA